MIRSNTCCAIETTHSIDQIFHYSYTYLAHNERTQSGKLLSKKLIEMMTNGIQTILRSNPIDFSVIIFHKFLFLPSVERLASILVAHDHESVAELKSIELKTMLKILNLFFFNLHGSYISTVLTRSDPLNPPIAITLSFSTANPALKTTNRMLMLEMKAQLKYKNKSTHRHRRDGISAA